MPHSTREMPATATLARTRRLDMAVPKGSRLRRRPRHSTGHDQLLIADSRLPDGEVAGSAHETSSARAAAQNGSEEIAVIYDTCYLMKGRRPLTREWLLNIEKDWRARREYKRPLTWLSRDERRELLQCCFDPSFAKTHSSKLQLAQVLPAEVKVELSAHLSRTDTASAARVGRRAVARLLDDACYYEPNLTASGEGAETPRDALGADSLTDRRLIRHARRLAEQGAHKLVLVATDDGGIIYDVASLRRATGLQVYCVSFPDDAIQQLPLHSLFDQAQRELDDAARAADRRRTILAISSCIIAAVALIAFVVLLWNGGYLFPIIKYVGGITAAAILFLSCCEGTGTSASGSS